ncbi:putative squalene-hopene-cyclase [Auricularia subglabra TFB-10046 SS5]|nr:putative squalene-hopene-cyclase [Auricularia subglabra TFB-10046 SS5]
MEDTTASLVTRVKAALSRATQYAWDIFRPDNHWHGELLSNATMTAEQVFFYQSLGITPIPDADAYRRWLLHDQRDDGSWALAPDRPGHLSVSCEAYLALKILGVDPSDDAMVRAREFIRVGGGVAKVRIFTRIYFAMFGLFPWSAVPALPVEFIFAPSWFPMNIYRVSSWARSTIVPLLLISHHQAVYALPDREGQPNANSAFLDELWLNPTNKAVPYGPSGWNLLVSDWVSILVYLVDALLQLLGGLRGLPFIRGLARQRCVEWILQHQEPEGDWSGTVPPMHAGVHALMLEGFKLEDSVIQRAIAAVERFTWEDGHGKRLQPSVSPVWDTLLMTRAVLDAGCCAKDDARLQATVACIRSRQLYVLHGDWRVYRPHLAPGGFCFEHHNAWYPDTDDTHAAILALVHQDADSAGSDAVAAAANWLVGMQSADGGWGAFDVENDRLWLNKIPFSDMGALCDPSTADVTGHVLEAFGTLLALKGAIDPRLHTNVQAACERGIRYLAEQQEPCGAWFGRWGVNYIYGTSGVLCGFAFFAERDARVRGMLRSGAAWLKQVQNTDGGWGEGLGTYREADKTAPGTGSASTPSQTAWALMGLLAAGVDTADGVVVSAVEYLLRTQTDASREGSASWPERLYTGVGFPNHFYLGYTLYRHYFPMMALGRYAAASGKPKSG